MLRHVPNLASILHEKNHVRDHLLMALFNYKTNGSFLELGATDNPTMSGTYLLEHCLKWRGVCIESDPKKIANYEDFRTCRMINHSSIFESNLISTEIDYLNINSENPLPILKTINFTKYRISTISLFTTNNMHDSLLWRNGYSRLVRYGAFEQFVKKD